MVQEKIKYIPNKAGVYCLYFPNGKKYFGSSAKVRTRIREHLYQLFPNPQKDFSKAMAQWYKQCRVENPNMTGYDVEIKWELCQEYRKYESEKLQSIAANEELKSQFFNSVWR